MTQNTLIETGMLQELLTGRTRLVTFRFTEHAEVKP